MTKLETAKKEILSQTKSFTLKTVKENSGLQISIDTFRKALNRLKAEEKVLWENPAEGKYYVKKTEEVKFVASPKTLKKGWKMKFIQEQLSRFRQMSRSNLAQLIDSDEKNTHIMISKINQKLNKLGQDLIAYDRESQSYQY